MRPRAHLIINEKSGVGKGSTLTQEFKKICEELNYELVEYTIHCPEELEQQSRIAADRALNTCDVVIAAGGDGTIRSVAQAAYGKNVRFAVVPCGTFNFFARAHNIPEDHLAAFRLALTGLSRPVRLGLVNGQVFLINASLGLYAKAIKDRERNTNRFGRHQLVVIISTILSFFSKHRLLKVDLLSKDKFTTLYTPMIFIGNNALQLRNLALNVAHCMKANLLAVVMMKPITKSEITRIIFKGIFKTLEDEENVDSFCVDSLTIYTRKPTNLVALDGETMRMNSPLHINALPESLNMVLPTQASLASEPLK
ncbi:diacylglycerol kinase family protein [Nitrosomonas sp. Nm166]|uniref:diacylglycerol/lipid kinase family protein n=1 Tax=Nitrosomonas sp. Nm166 TaxID=1881054 RepID=UPI0008EAEE3B|nr:diacylglycerol kinase family protein [Nitrosomonas sp. Nm166]SFF26223.1 Diacylglycerol kinase family enzyme [Nitrosomonas sp. Nm166]